jgi:hypothetical protein
MKSLKKPDQIKETDIKRLARDLIIYICVNLFAFIGGQAFTQVEIAGLFFCSIITGCLVVYLLLNRKHKLLVTQLWGYIEAISQTNIDIVDKLNIDAEETIEMTVQGLQEQLNHVLQKIIELKDTDRKEINNIDTKKYRRQKNLD